MLEGLRLCKALWSGQPVDWDGRWQITQAVVAPTPIALVGRSSGSAAICRAAWSGPDKFFDGWFPIAPSAPDFATGLAHVRDCRPTAWSRSGISDRRDVPDTVAGR